MPHDIAVVGLSCRLPGASDPQEFWRMLSRGEHAIREVPSSRWDANRFYDPDPNVPGKTNTKWGGFLDSPGGFDCSFFNLTPEEAVHVDPQQRLILELGWEALEDAGIAPESLRGSGTAVYIGISHNDYERIIYRSHERITRFHGTGSYQSVAANRLSYFLNVVGPSMTVDTACSSTLAALHTACHALRMESIPLALVGGITLHLTPDETIGLTKGYMLSPDGRCKSFDASGDGYVRGEGGGVAILKRLEDALRDEDRILGIIKGSAINHNGRSNGLSSPSGLALKRVMEDALRTAGVAPADVSFLEAHGTGTRMGDQIELKAIREVYDTLGAEPLWLGCVKTNIGHLETASGMASLAKVLLALQRQSVPPNLHYTGEERVLGAAPSRLRVPLRNVEWPSGGRPRMAAITTYGFGGANGHLVIQEPPPAELRARGAAGKGDGVSHVLCLSARDEGALRELIAAYSHHLRDGAAADFPSVCYTAAVGRNSFEWRAAFVARDAGELADQLAARAAAAGTRPAGRRSLRAPRLALRFGAAWPAGVIEALAAGVPSFAARLRQVRAAAASPSGTAAELFTAQLALGQCLIDWGLAFAVVVGEGVGHWAAQALSGSMTLEVALLAAFGSGTGQPAANAVQCDLVPDDAQLISLGGCAARDGSAWCLLNGDAADDPRVELQRLLAGMYDAGARLNWRAWYAAGPSYRRMALPTYPFQRKTMWFTTESSQPLSSPAAQELA